MGRVRERSFSLRRGAMRVITAVLLAVAMALSALGIPVPWRVPSSVAGRKETEEVHDAGEPDGPPPARRS